MSQELKCCPFCGEQAEHETCMDESLWSHETVPYGRVGCGQCRIWTDWTCEGYEPNEYDAWNHRQLESASQPGGGEAVEAAVKAALSLYADSYAAMRGDVHSSNVAYDIRMNFADSIMQTIRAATGAGNGDGV